MLPSASGEGLPVNAHDCVKESLLLAIGCLKAAIPLTASSSGQAVESLELNRSRLLIIGFHRLLMSRPVPLKQFEDVGTGDRLHNLAMPIPTGWRHIPLKPNFPWDPDCPGTAVSEQPVLATPT